MSTDRMGTHSSRSRYALRVAAAVAAVALLATPAVITGIAPANAAGAGPSTSTPTVAPGSSVTISFSTSGTATAKDWIGFYASGAIQSTCPSPSTHWAYTSSGTTTAGATAVANGAVTFSTAGWSLGRYSVYLCRNDGYTSVGTPITVDVATLTTSSTTVAQGSTVTFGFAAPAAQSSATNWIGLYSAASGSTPGHGASTYWDYVNSGTQTAGATAVASGSLGFSTAGWPLGAYSVHFLYADGYTDIGSPITITVVLPAADVLDVDFSSGAPVDHAQARAATTYGSPTIATDAAIGKKTATFNGSGDAYQYDFSSAYSQLTRHFSVECQFRWNGPSIPPGTSTFPSVCSGLQSGGMGLIVYNGELDFELNVGGYKDVYAPIAPGTWYDAIGTWDGTTARIYLDGALVASVPASGTLTLPTPAAKGWSLGADLSGSGGVEQFAPVSLGVARVFTAAMTADAVAAEYRLTNPTNPVTVTQTGLGSASSSLPSALPGATVTLSETPAAGFSFSGWKVVSPADGSVTIADDGTFTMPGVPVVVQAIFTADPGTTAPGSWSSLPAGFVTDAFHLPAIRPHDSVSQRLLGLWNGSSPTTFSRVSGDDWLSVSTGGVVSGTAPTGADGGEITVSATNGATTSQILVEVPVATSPTVQAATWNAWAGGTNVTDAVGKNLRAVASRGLSILAFQDGGAAMARQVGDALGWQVAISGDLGIVSSRPFTGATRVESSAAAPAFAVTVDVDGQAVRVWDVGLDESSSDTSGRAAQARSIVTEARPDVRAAATVPVLLLGDLGAPDLATLFTGSGLVDAYRQANPAAGSGASWPLFASSASTATRVDYVLAAGDRLELVDADQVSAGWPSASSPAGNSWASDHTAVVGTFTLGGAGSSSGHPSGTASGGRGHAAAPGSSVTASAAPTTAATAAPDPHASSGAPGDPGPHASGPRTPASAHSTLDTSAWVWIAVLSATLLLLLVAAGIVIVVRRRA